MATKRAPRAPRLDPDAPASADGRRRQARGDARRQQILDAAVSLFAEKGYRGSGLAELAERLGVTHQGLLYYFGTKERLLLEVVAERQRVEAGVLDGPVPTDVFEALAGIARFNMRTRELTRLYAVLGAENLDPGDPLHDFFVHRYDNARHVAADVIRQGQADGQIRPDVDPDQAGREIIAMLMGLELQWLMDPRRLDLTEAMDAYLADLRVRLGPPRPQPRQRRSR